MSQFKTDVFDKNKQFKTRHFSRGEKKNGLYKASSRSGIKQDFFRGAAVTGRVEGLPLTSDKAAKRFGNPIVFVIQA